jgi:hypothetical protein
MLAGIAFWMHCRAGMEVAEERNAGVGHAFCCALRSDFQKGCRC